MRVQIDIPEKYVDLAASVLACKCDKKEIEAAVESCSNKMVVLEEDDFCDKGSEFYFGLALIVIGKEQLEMI